MAQSVQPLVSCPAPAPGDTEDVVWALETAAAVWARGDLNEALRWLRRAAEHCADAGDDLRAVTLARAMADLSERMRITPSQPPRIARSADDDRAPLRPPPDADERAEVRLQSDVVPKSPWSDDEVTPTLPPPPRSPKILRDETDGRVESGAHPIATEAPPQLDEPRALVEPSAQAHIAITVIERESDDAEPETLAIVEPTRNEACAEPAPAHISPTADISPMPADVSPTPAIPPKSLPFAALRQLTLAAHDSTRSTPVPSAPSPAESELVRDASLAAEEDPDIQIAERPEPSDPIHAAETVRPPARAARLHALRVIVMPSVGGRATLRLLDESEKLPDGAQPALLVALEPGARLLDLFE